MILTDEEMLKAYTHATGKRISHRKSERESFFRSSRAIESAVIAKLNSAEPVCEWKKADGSNYIKQEWHPEYIAKLGDKLFTHPPSPVASAK